VGVGWGVWARRPPPNPPPPNPQSPNNIIIEN